MKNNRLPLIHDPRINPIALRARNALIRRYNALRQNGGWRTVQKELGIKNVATVYNFAVHGIEPKNIEERKRLGLKKRCPVCKRTIKENDKAHTHTERPPFLLAWMKLPATERHGVIQKYLEYKHRTRS